MSAQHRLWLEWLAQWIEEGGSVGHLHQDDLEEAYKAGWDDLASARWETSAVPMLGIEGGEVRGPVLP